ncbi:protein translocase subunit SecF [Aliivibrio kagoshimensis]|uniref:protein translocase subunit SecF n=1 Tax=Aliivibrio kagoshimensis TaxID=2910230 RepID=UPI003D137E8F
MIFSMKNATQWRHFSSVVSVFLMLFSLFMIANKGLNLGLDFTGGVVSEVQLDSRITSSEIEPLLKEGLHADVTVISTGESGRWVLRYAAPQDGSELAPIHQLLAPLDSHIEVLNTSIVGPQVGQELAEQGGMALMVSMISIMLYLSFRFEWRLALGSLFALTHDVIFILGFFALTQMEFNLTVLAAVLAIMGYSLNDSIIISDRIREYLISKPSLSIQEVNNQAIVSTFSRTMITSGTTLMTVGALWLLGGGPLAGFATAMFIGIVTGTFSSVSVGTALPELFGLRSEHYLVKPVSEEP